MGNKISVIVPVLNEAANLLETLARLRRSPEVELIVVDAGSQDASVEIAQRLGARVRQTQPGRAYQMNVGAEMATGEVLLFLHADTRLPEDFVANIHQTLNQPGVVAGAFDLSIQGTHPGLRLVEWGVYWRSRVCQLPYGDQALFLPTRTFHRVSGFPDLPILEDFVLVRRLQRYGKVAIAPGRVTTSGRRWQRLGIGRTTLTNQLVVLGYHVGIPPLQLARWYHSLK
jgi:rSAM/selenodomain-associated transferase 2